MFIFFSDDSGEPGYLAVKLLILCSSRGLMSDLKALFSRSGFIADEESSGSKRISSIREQALSSSANKVANMKMNRRLSSMIFRNIDTANRSEALKSAIFELYLSQKLNFDYTQTSIYYTRYRGGLGMLAILVMTGIRYACHVNNKRD